MNSAAGHSSLAELVKQFRSQLGTDLLEPKAFANPTEIAADDALVLIGCLAAVVFNAEYELVFCNLSDPAVQPHISWLLDNGNLHDPAVFRYRLLRWCGVLLNFFSLNNRLSVVDFVVACTCKGRPSLGGGGGGLTPQQRPPQTLATWLTPVLRLALDFIRMRQDLLSQCEDVVTADQQTQVDLATVIEELAAMGDRLDCSPGVEALKSEIETTQQAVTEAKRNLETAIKEMESVREKTKLGEEQQQMQQTCLQATEEQLRVLHDVVNKLQQQVVENPQALRQKCKEAESDCNTAEASLRQALERNSQLKAVQSLSQQAKPLVEQLAHAVEQLKTNSEEFDKLTALLETERRENNQLENQLRHQQRAHEIAMRQLETGRRAKEHELELALQNETDLRRQAVELQRQEAAVKAEITTIEEHIQQLYAEGEAEETRFRRLVNRVDDALRVNSPLATEDETTNCRNTLYLRESSGRINRLLQSLHHAANASNGEPRA